MIEELPFSDLHVFPYSRRPGTRAAALPGQVPGNVINMRAALLRDSAARKKAGFLGNQAGMTLQVLVQGCNESSSVCNGISRNYVIVQFPGQADIINTEQSVKVETFSGEHATGHIVMTGPTRR
jgi:threonylcarbamoyladenosine tRNA methylthiotransferase MtaB